MDKEFEDFGTTTSFDAEVTEAEWSSAGSSRSIVNPSCDNSL